MLISEGGYMKQRDRAKGEMRLVNDISRLDPDGGVLVHTTCWRPRLGDPNPEQPGESVHHELPPNRCSRSLSLWQWQTLWRLLPTAAVLATSLPESGQAGI